MKAIPITAQVRDAIGKRLKKIRKDGFLPATVYGKNIKSASLMLPLKDFMKVYKQAGETGLVNLEYNKETVPTLIADVQWHPLTRTPLHVQFHAVNLKEKIKANVPLEIIGESSAVQNNIGLLLQTLNEVEVESLPADLPEKIVVDVAGLTEVGQQITVGELAIPSAVELLTLKEEIVVKLAPAVSEEAKKEAEAAAASAAEKTATEPAPEQKPAEEVPAA